MSRQYLFAFCLSFLLVVGGCKSEQERAAERQHQERIAAEQARQQRLAAQYAANLAAETERMRDALEAQTARRRIDKVTALGKVVAFLAAIGGVIAWAVYAIRRLGERHLKERTKRHGLNLKAIQADPHLSPEHRQKLFQAAIEAASRGGRPLIGYDPN